MKGVRSAFGYYGGKVFLSPGLQKVMPEHRIYIEPFVGGGAVYYMKDNKAEVNVLNDLDGFVYNAYRVIKDWRKLKIRVYKEPWHLLSGDEKKKKIAFRCIKHEAERYQIKEFPDVRGFFLFYVRMRFGYNCNSWSPSDRLIKSKDIDMDKLFGHFDECCDKLNSENAVLLNDDFEAVLLNKEFNTEDAFAYLDPPYIQAMKRKYYGFNDVTPERVAEVLKKFKGKWIVSYNNSSRVISAFEDIAVRMIVFEAPYETKSAPLEILIGNYEFNDPSGLNIAKAQKL